MSGAVIQTGAELLVDALTREGVTHVFGLPGTTVMDIIDAFARQDQIRYISTRHEQCAAFMADGFARGSREVGVCLASRGPGAANIAIGLHNAFAESIPVLGIVGQVPDHIAYREAFEEMDLVAFFRPVTKWSFEAHRPERIPELVQRAVRTAVGGRPRPVVASIPLDALQAEVENAQFGNRARLHAPSPNPADVARARRLLDGAARPILLLGGGMAGPEFDAAVIEVAEQLAIPVATTWLRKNAFPNSHPSFIGPLGFGALPVTENALGEADVVVALGCRFSEFVTRRWTLLASTVDIVQVDLDAEELGRTYIPTVGVQADASAFAAALAAAGGENSASPAQHSRAERLRGLRAAYEAESALDSETREAPVPSASVLHALQAVLDRQQAVIVQDVPTFGAWIARHLRVDRPGTLYGSGGGSMGWGFPAAMGIQLARPDVRVMCVTGDGSFWMVAQDLETAVREDIPIVTLVVNNFSFGNTRDRQRFSYDSRFLGVFYSNPDFAEFARLLGAHGERVERAAQLGPAIDRALESGRPAVVDIIQDAFEGLPIGLQPPSAR